MAKSTTRESAGNPASAGGRSDRCKSLREQLAEIDREIAEIREALDQPDVPEHVKAALRERLSRLKPLRARVLGALEA
jgi:hypothetical protein